MLHPQFKILSPQHTSTTAHRDDLDAQCSSKATRPLSAFSHCLVCAASFFWHLVSHYGYESTNTLAAARILIRLIRAATHCAVSLLSRVAAWATSRKSLTWSFCRIYRSQPCVTLSTLSLLLTPCLFFFSHILRSVDPGFGLDASMYSQLNQTRTATPLSAIRQLCRLCVSSYEREPSPSAASFSSLSSSSYGPATTCLPLSPPPSRRDWVKVKPDRRSMKYQKTSQRESSPLARCRPCGLKKRTPTMCAPGWI